MLQKFSRVAIVIAIGLFALASCGQQSGGQSSSGGADGKVSLQNSTIEFAWPDGYTYDTETNLLLAPSGPKDNYLPSYLTSINIKIVASDGTVWYDNNFSPSEDMTLDFQLDAGTYTFYATAITTTEETYTAQQTLTLTAGAKARLLFNFRLNAVPTISASAPGSVIKGASANIQVTATDLDDGDTLTITKNANGGTLGRSAAKESALSSVVNYLTQAVLNITWTAPDKKGTYKITFTVTDGHGGIAVTTVTISSVNRAPTVTITSDKSSVDEGDDIEFTCTASDQDSSDSGNLSLSFSGGPSSSGTGGTITETYTTQSSDGSSVTATCTATDSDGDSGSASVTVTITPPPVVTSDCEVRSGGGFQSLTKYCSQ